MTQQIQFHDHTLDVKAVNRHKIKPDPGRQFKELDFGITP